MPAEDVFRSRRQRLVNRLGDGLVLLPTAPLRLRNGDVFHSFRPDSNFYYLTGFDEPEAVLACRRVDRTRHRAVLFLRPRDPAREIWDGARLGPARARRKLGVDEAYAISDVYGKVEDLLRGCARLFYTLGVDERMDRSLATVFERLAIESYRGNPFAHPAIEDPRPTISAERLRKDPVEIAALERAAEITARGHCRAMEAARPGMMEYELQAEIEAAFRRAGSPRNGYDSIVASGANACTLHYVSSSRRMRAGDLVLVDAGAERELYTADITRTFPVSGSFSPEQSQVYRLVLRAQKAAIRAVRPGRAWNAPHRAAVGVIVDGLRSLELLTGPRRQILAKARYRRWFMHGTSHWLGMDVHDAGGYLDPDGKPKRLRPGMVLTVEPGLYFGSNDRSVPKRFRGIGVRIEDDVLVTRGGCRVLTAGVPKEIREIEAICRGETNGRPGGPRRTRSRANRDSLTR